MDKKELVELTAIRIGNLTEIEFKHSIDCSEDYPLHMKELLQAIHTKPSDYERVGKSLMMYLYAHNEFDIDLHEGL